MARFVYDIGFRTEDYRKHLQENAYAQDVKSEVASSSQAIIASNKRLQQEGIRTIEGVRDGINQLTFSVRDFTDGQSAIIEGQHNMTEALWANADRLDAIIELQNHIGYALNIGFRGVSEAVCAVRDLIRKSIDIAEHQSQTWANEQFEIAKKAFEKGWSKESLVSLDRAIHGHESHPGYEIDHRFHLMKGLVLSGSGNPKETDLVDLPEAEKSFLLAVRYSELDHPKQAARSYFLASWAAYCDGRNDEAIKHGLSALKIDNDSPEYSYNLAKYLFHADRAEAGSKYLETAILKNKFYSIEAASDADFQKDLDALNGVLEKLRSEKEKQVQGKITKLKELLHEGREAEKEAGGSYLEGTFIGTKKMLENICETISEPTYFNLLDAEKMIPEVREMYVEDAIKSQVLIKKHLSKQARNKKKKQKIETTIKTSIQYIEKIIEKCHKTNSGSMNFSNIEFSEIEKEFESIKAETLKNNFDAEQIIVSISATQERLLALIRSQIEIVKKCYHDSAPGEFSKNFVCIPTSMVGIGVFSLILSVKFALILGLGSLPLWGVTLYINRRNKRRTEENEKLYPYEKLRSEWGIKSTIRVPFLSSLEYESPDLLKLRGEKALMEARDKKTIKAYQKQKDYRKRRKDKQFLGEKFDKILED